MQAYTTTCSTTSERFKYRKPLSLTMSEQLPIEEFQDLGELKQTIRTIDEVGPSGVEPLVPDDSASHGEALQNLRAVIDEYYGDHLDRLANEDEEVIIERLVVLSDDLPYIEYSIVEAREE